jgi:hypothetical protein
MGGSHGAICRPPESLPDLASGRGSALTHMTGCTRSIPRTRGTAPSRRRRLAQCTSESFRRPPTLHDTQRTFARQRGPVIDAFEESLSRLLTRRRISISPMPLERRRHGRDQYRRSRGGLLPSTKETP